MRVSKTIFLLVLGLTSSWACWGQIGGKGINGSIGDPLISSRVESAPSRGSGIIARYISDSAAVFRLEKGDGEGRIMVVREGAPVSADLTRKEGYTPNPVFGEGEDLGNGNFVLSITTDLNYFDTVYLSPNTQYHFKTWEYNIVDGEYYYFSSAFFEIYSNIANLKTPSRSSLLFSKDTAITASFIEFYPQYGPADIVYINPANPNRSVTFYPESADATLNMHFDRFGLPEEFNFVVYDGDSVGAPVLASKADISADTLITATNDQGALTVFFEYTGSINLVYWDYGAWIAQVYETGNTELGPTIPVSNFAFDSIGVDDAAYHWEPGNEDGALVLMSRNPISASPQTGMAYVADTVFGQGTDLGGGTYAVAFETTNALQVSGLEEEGTYYVKIFGYLEDENGDRYFNPAAALDGAFNFVEGPVWNGVIRYQNLTDTSVSINWDPGNADGTLVTYSFDAMVEDNVLYDSTPLPPMSEELSPANTSYWQVGTDTTLTVSPLVRNGSLEYLEVRPYKVSEYGINYGKAVSLDGVKTLRQSPPDEPGEITVVNISYGKIDMSVDWQFSRMILVAAKDTLPALAQLTTIDRASLNYGTRWSEEYPRTSLLWGLDEFITAGDTITVTGLEPGTEYIFEAVTYVYDRFVDQSFYYIGEDGYDTLKTLNDVLTMSWEDDTPEVWCAGESFQVQYRKNVATTSNRELRLQVQQNDGSYDTLSPEAFSSVLSDGALNFSGILTVPDLPTNTYNFRWWLSGLDDSTYSPDYTIDLIYLEEPEITTSGATLASSVTGDSVQWFFNEEYAASGASLPNGNRAGVYTVRVYQDGCSRDSEPLVVTGLEDEFSVAGLMAYPNPTTSELRMLIPAAMQDQRVTVTVLTPQGRTALKATNHPAEAPIRVDHLRTGMYYLHVEGEQYHSSTAFYKE